MNKIMNTNLGQIRMSSRAAGAVVIDIEGIIGVPEDWQFENQDQRVSTYERFRQTIGQIAVIEASLVRVNIRSQGGNVNDALLIYDALCALDARVETFCHGYVASAATIIAQAGVVRKISSGTLYLIHRATSAFDGNAADAMQMASLLNKTDERIVQLYASRSGCEAAEFRELMSRDSGKGEWLTPEEVMAVGLADEVVRVSPLSKLTRKIRNFFKLEDDFELYHELEQGRGIENIEKRIDEINKYETQNKTEPELQKNQPTEADIAKSRAMPSLTTPKEDPVIEMLQPKTSANYGSYAQDVETFRSTIV